MPHHELAETILEESGYTDMWKKDRSADSAGRLENLKELVRAMEDFENLQGFLEHVSLVMEKSSGEGEDRVTAMTLHAAKGLEFETVFLPGWEEGLFPSQRSLDEQGRAGLEEERRLAYVGLTRAKRRAKLYFATNRRIHGMWQASIPSRFLDELPAAHVEISEGPGTNYAASQRQGYGSGHFGGNSGSRFENIAPFPGGGHASPGMQRMHQNQPRTGGNFGQDGYSARETKTARAGSWAAPAPRQIEARATSSSISTASRYDVGARVFHLKFGPGDVAVVDGNKLTVDFDKAGRKMVLDSFVQAG